MRQTLVVLLSISIFLAACAPATPPAPTPDINATISAMSSTSVAATLTAQPTATVLPSNTPLPTETPLPTNTPEPIVSNSPTPVTPTITPISATTATSVPFIGCFAPAGTGNTSMGVFRMENNTTESIEVNLHGVSLNGNVEVNCSFTVTASFNTEIIFGNYSYYIQIGSKKSIEGSFTITNDDKTTMRIFDKKVVVVGP